MVRKLLTILYVIFSLSSFAQDLDAILHRAHVLRNVEVDSSIQLVRYVLQKSKETGEKQLLARSLCHLGNLYRLKSNHTEAVQILREGVVLCLEIKDSITLSKIYNNTGLSHRDVGNYDSAIVYFHKSIVANHDETAKACHNIGIVYSSLGNYIESERYFDKSFMLYQAKHDTLGMAKIINNKGSLFYELGEYEKAKQFYFQYLNLLPQDRERSREIALGNIGTTYEALNQLDSAFVYIVRGLQISRQINDHVGIIFNLSNAASILRKQNKHFAALELYRQAFRIADSLNSKTEMKNILFSISDTYNTLRDYEKSLIYFKQYTALKDSLLDEKTSSLIVKEQEKYNAAERDKDIIRLRAEKKEKEQAERNLQYLIVGIIMVVLIISIFLMYLFRFRNKQRRAENERRVVYSMLDAEEKTKEEISQEIHDNLASRLAYVRMMLSSVKKEVPPEKYNPIENVLIESMEISRQISHKLFASDLKDLGLIPAIKYFFSGLNEHGDAHFHFETSMDAGERMNWNTELNLFRITQELVNNTLKYAHATNVMVRLDFNNGHLLYTYADDGNGFNKENIKVGVGISGILNRGKRIGAHTSIQSSPGEGVNITISVPANQATE